MDGQTHTRAKWGRSLDHSGFQIIPNVLLTAQNELGISPADLVVLLHINRYWWRRDQNPFPSSAWIAKQMGLHTRSVERHLKQLEKKELIQLQAPRVVSGRTVRPISLLPLATSLEEIVKEKELDL